MLGPALTPRDRRDDRHRGDHRARRRLAVRLLDARGAAARRDRRRHRRRRDLRAAARLDAAAPARAHARGRGRAATTRSRSCSCSASSTGSGEPGYGLAGHGRGCFVRQLGDRRSRSASLVGWLAVVAFRAARLASAGLYPVASLATAALAFGARRRLHGSGFLAVYLAGLMLGAARRSRRKQTDRDLPRGPRVGGAARRCSSCSACSCSRRSSATWRSKGTVLALVLVFVARPLATWSRHAVRGFTPAERIVLGWAGLRGAVPVVLATFPVIEGVAAQPRVLQHRVLRRRALDARCRARRSSRSPRAWA